MCSSECDMNQMCVQCGKGKPDSEGICPVCGGLTDPGGLYIENEGMEKFNARVANTVRGLQGIWL